MSNSRRNALRKSIRMDRPDLPPVKPTAIDIPAPTHAVSIWLEGDEFCLKFLDAAPAGGHTVRIKIGDARTESCEGRIIGAKHSRGVEILLQLLLQRSITGHRPIGTLAAPTNWRLITNYISDVNYQKKVEKLSEQKRFAKLSPEQQIEELWS